MLDSGSFVSGTWIPDYNRYEGSGFLELYSGFQDPGFQIPVTGGHAKPFASAQLHWKGGWL